MAPIYNKNGESHRALGKSREALQCFDRALELDPHINDAQHAKSDLEQARGMRSSGSWWDAMHGKR